MIYAYDEPVQFPVVDLYDSGMMGAFLTAAKDQYDTALKEQADFIEKYGDFYSPIASDVDAWYGYINPVYDEIDRIYAEGGDPLRNPVDRARIRQMRGRVPRQELAKLKESAKAAEEYLKNRAKLEQAGKYNPAFEAMILNNMGLPDFEHWDTAKNGIWNRQSPAEFQDLNEYTSHIFDDLKDSTIGMSKDGKWIIKGVDEKAMRAALTPHLGGIVGSDLGKWYYDQAKRELITEGNSNPTDAEIMQRLQDNIITSNAERRRYLQEVNEYEKQRIDNAAALQRQRVSASSGGGGQQYPQAPYRPWDTAVLSGLFRSSGTNQQNATPANVGNGLMKNTMALIGQYAHNMANGMSNDKALEQASLQLGISDPTDFAVRGGFDTRLSGSEGYTLRQSDKSRIYSDTDLTRMVPGAKTAVTSVVGKNAADVLFKYKTTDMGGFTHVRPVSSDSELITIPVVESNGAIGVHQYRRVELVKADDKSNITGTSYGWYDYGRAGWIDQEGNFVSDDGANGQRDRTNALILHGYGGPAKNENIGVRGTGISISGRYE